MKKTSDSQLRAVKKYNAANTKQYNFRLNKNTDAEIIAHLERQENKIGYLKNLILQDLRNKK